MSFDSTEGSASPTPWFARGERVRQFEAKLRGSTCPVLICDYDGTLAPFMADKMQAFPYPGVIERLEHIHANRTRLVFVSGRPVRELLSLVPLTSTIELWGSHGREHRMPPPPGSPATEAAYSVEAVAPVLIDALDRVEAALVGAGYRAETERKSASIAVHWRNLDGAGAEKLKHAAEEIFGDHAAHEEFAVMPFESGLELRVADYTKAHAVRAVLAGAAPGDAVAYLGDDTTDEDAFEALGPRGLSLLVRHQPRPSLAQGWLCPPDELLRFLDAWASALEPGRRE